MRHTFHAILLVLLAFTSPLDAAPSAGTLNTQDLNTQAVPLFTLEAQIHTRTLDNGIIVRTLNLADKHSVSIASQFNVGSANETQGQTGYAHLFEHMLFKGSQNVPADSYATELNALGARFNAMTDFDHTTYYLTLPANALALGLYLESDRFIRPTLNATNIKNQQDTVLQEMAQRIDNQSYMRKAMEYLLSQVKGTPYGHAVIGSKQDIESATPETLQAFHQDYYRPDALQLTVVGQLTSNAIAPVDNKDVTTAENGDVDVNTDVDVNANIDVNANVDNAIERYFGPWSRPSTPVHPTPAVQIIPHASIGEVVDERGPWPGLLLAWHTVGASHSDAAAISLLQDYLFQNRTSLIAKAGLNDPNFMLNYSIPLKMAQHGVTNLVLVPRSRASLNELTEQVQQLIDDVSQNGISEESLTALKQIWLNRQLAKLDDTEALALQLSSTLAQDRNQPLTAPWRRIQAVTTDDIQRVCRQYFSADRLVRLDLLPPWYVRLAKTLLEWLPKSVSDGIEDSAL